MKIRTLAGAGVLIAALLAGCTRPEGAWRERNQLTEEAATPGPVELPEVETQSVDETSPLVNEIDALLNDLEIALYAQVEWQLDVPDETSLLNESTDGAEPIDELLGELATSLLSLGDALAEESGQQIDTP